ncbi:multiple sugar transport system substrate-binding protein [Hypnocyclicus thermotrophus]|uniref:Multiple sugar transport system substrate-binding protein n=1 Tax=Hypnocyclicus thermotrophus TaxID=1627895 RepID=A0AA46I666_9FUSO|nr:extracellular solute-binding protein [Hypnocyclicus thermotrophus]TDT71998.1 multiple sugar transport system substrate-binding protein [Hypnocyclicus thermotrophus]
MKIKTKFLLVISILVLFSMTSFAGLFFKKEETKEQKKDDKVVIKLWVTPDAEHEEDLQAILDKFEKKSRIKVEKTVLGWDIVWDKLTTAATSGIGPDVVEIGGTWVSSIAAMGVLEDLSKYYDANEVKSHFLEPTLKYSKVKGVEGDLISLPWITDGYLFYYRKDLYEKAGLDPNEVFKDWDSFKEAMRRLDNMDFTNEKGEKIAAFAHGGKNDWNIIHMMGGFIWQAGGNYINEEGTKALIAEDNAINGIKYFTSFAQEGIVPKEYLEKDPSEIEALYGAGNIATILTGPWFASYLEKTLAGKYDSEADDVNALNLEKNSYKNTDVAQPLAGPAGRYTFSGTNNLAVFNFSKHKKEAAELVKYLTTDKEAQIDYCNATGLFTVSKNVANSPYVTENHFRSAVKYAFDHGYIKVYPAVPAWGPIETVLTKNLGIIWDLVSGVEGEYTEEKLIEKIKETNTEMERIISQTGNR